MDLPDAFDIRDQELVTVLGGALKTDLLYALGRALADRGRRVVTTSTTPFPVPAASQCGQCLSDPEVEVVYRDTIERLKYFPHVTVGLGGQGGRVTTLPPDTGRKLKEVPDHFVRTLHANPGIDCVIVNGDPMSGDGVARIPVETTTLVPVSRSALRSLPPGYEKSTRVIPYLCHDREGPDALARSRGAAEEMIANPEFEIRRVVIGAPDASTEVEVCAAREPSG